MDYIKEFTSTLEALDRSKNISTVFLDFLTLSMCSLAQPFYRSQNLEQRYKNTICNYTKEQAEEFSKLLARLISALEEKHQDFLGQVFSANNFGNARKGQFFTPYHVSKLMAQINFTDIENQLAENNFVTLAEPCCGSGGIIIEFAEILKEQGYNYQHQLFVEAIDIDETCFKMAYIQLSILGIPARVMLGDTLAWKFQKVLYTPLYFVNSFEYKLKHQQQEQKKPVIVGMKQLNLF